MKALKSKDWGLLHNKELWLKNINTEILPDFPACQLILQISALATPTTAISQFLKINLCVYVCVCVYLWWTMIHW